jgi:hypothetical protein
LLIAYDAWALQYFRVGEESVKPSSSNEASMGATPAPSPTFAAEPEPPPKPTPTPTALKPTLESAEADLAHAWKSLSSEQRTRLSQEEQKWVKNTSSLPEEERIKACKNGPTTSGLWSDGVSMSSNPFFLLSTVVGTLYINQNKRR